jgi:hypothetical protein
MFPYGAIIASQMLNRKNKREAQPPQIETLSSFTKLSAEEFYDLLVERSKTAGIIEMCDLITNWQGFDKLTVQQRARFVKEIEEPEYYSIRNRLKRFFNR